MDEIQDLLVNARDRVRDQSISLLSDAVYRNDDNAKALERQCAKISRAIDKALHECNVLEKMTDGADS